MKYRIIKQESELLPYQVQRKTIFGWQALQHIRHIERGYVDNRYRTLVEARSALDNFLKREEGPRVVYETEG